MKLTLRFSGLWPAIVLAVVLPGAALAQPYPTKAIRFIVPYAPGGSVDIVSRVIAPKLAESFGQQVVVDNRPGAGAIIGTNLLAKSAPDGYTIMMADIALGANPALHSKLPYNTPEDFAPVTLVALLPSILVVHPSLPVKSVTAGFGVRPLHGQTLYGSLVGNVAVWNCSKPLRPTSLPYLPFTRIPRTWCWGDYAKACRQNRCWHLRTRRATSSESSG